MKKLVFLLIFAALFTFGGCSSDKGQENKTDQRVEAPNDPDTEKRPTTTKAEDHDTSDKSPVSSSPMTSDALSTSTPTSSSVSSAPTSSSPVTGSSTSKVTTANKDVTPAVPMSYRLEFKLDGGRYLLDADYNMSYVKDGDDPTFHKTVRTKFDDKRTSVYCSDLNKSLLLDKDGKGISAVTGRLEMPYDNFLIAYKNGSSADFRICDTSTGSTLIDTVYAGFNEREDGNVSLLRGKTQIDIFDGEKISDSRKYETVYYYVTTFVLVREDGQLRLYDTDFELLADFGKIERSNKMHFSETVFDGKGKFEFFFDSGSFKYDGIPTVETDDNTSATETTAPETNAETTAKNEDTTAKPETTAPESKEPETSAIAETTADTTVPDTTKAETSDTSAIAVDTTTQSTTKADTDKPQTSETTGKPQAAEFVLVAEADGIKLYECGGEYLVNINKKYLPVDGLENPIIAEIISENIDVLSVLNRDLTMSAYIINNDSVDEIDVGIVEVSKTNGLTIVNGAIRSHVLLDEEVMLSAGGPFTISGSFLLCYDMVTEQSSAYTLDCEPIVAPDDNANIALLDDGRLMIADYSEYYIIDQSYEISYSSKVYDEIFTAVNEKLLVNDDDIICLIDLDEDVIVEFDDISDWDQIYISLDESGYDSGELIGTPVYYFNFFGLKNGKYSTVEYSYIPQTGAVNVSEGN